MFNFELFLNNQILFYNIEEEDLLNNPPPEVRRIFLSDKLREEKLSKLVSLCRRYLTYERKGVDFVHQDGLNILPQGYSYFVTKG